MTDCINVVYIENRTELLCSIGLGAAYYEKQDKTMMWPIYSLVYAETETELLRPI